MRRWLLVLLIALLPLRGWMGDAMAAQMAVQPHAAANQAVHAAPSDCAGHHDQSEAAAPSLPDESPQADANCAACQACSTMALAFSHAPVPEPVFGAAPPAQPLVAFASAEPAPADKPPIS